MRARAERAAGVHHQVDNARANRLLLPGRADPEAVAYQHRDVEALPALGPIVGDLTPLHLNADARDLGLALRQRGGLARRAVERVLPEAWTPPPPPERGRPRPRPPPPAAGGARRARRRARPPRSLDRPPAQRHRAPAPAPPRAPARPPPPAPGWRAVSAERAPDLGEQRLLRG